MGSPRTTMVKIALLLFSSLLITIAGHAVKKTQNSGEDPAVERIEDDRRQPSEKEGLLEGGRMVREADASRREKISKKAMKTRTLKLRQKDRKEVKKGKIGSFSRRKTVKGGKNDKRKQKLKSTKNTNGKGVKKKEKM